MQGLRDEAKIAIASAMDEGKYPKSAEERQVEIDNWEHEAWVTHRECYCRRYVEAINKKCRDMWLSSKAQLTWFFDPFERLDDVSLAMAAEKMREFVTLKEEIQRCRDDVDKLHDSLVAAKNFIESRAAVFKAYKDAHRSVGTFMDLTYLSTMGPVLPAAQLKDARDSVAAWLISVNQVAKSWTDPSLLKMEDYKQALARYRGLCDDLLKKKPLLDAAAQACRQLRLVHPLGFAFMEAMAQTSPSAQPPLTMPAMPAMPPAETFPAHAPPPKQSSRSKNDSSAAAAEPPAKKLATSPK